MKPGDPKPIWSSHAASLLVAYAAITVASLWLRSAFPVFAIGNAGHDDLLFLNLARSIGRGHWLGDYTNLTLAKGMYYSAFIALSHGIGVPLKVAEQAAFLCAAGLMTWVVVRLSGKKYLGLILFAVLAFNPAMWSPWLARVIREGLYVSISLTLFALAAAAWLLRGKLQLPARARILVFIVLGLTAAAYYLTREEDLWLVPALAILAGYFLIAEWFETKNENKQRLRERWRRVAVSFALPAAMFAAAVGSVAAVNYARYGVFGSNEFRNSSFLAAYGALARIPHEEWRRFIFFPKDAREKAYAVSEAARELQPFLEGTMAAGWRRAGCEQTRTDPCPEILGGWWIWALRDAVQLAGHYRSGAAALAFYERLAREINEACDDGRLSCLPPRATLAPPFRWHYLRDALSPAARLTGMLVCLGCGSVGSPPSIGTDTALAFYKHMVGTISRTRPAESEPQDIPKLKIAGTLAKLYATLTLPLAVLALLGAFAAGVLAWFRPLRDPSLRPLLALMLALAAAMATRIALLAYIDATSLPAVRNLYLSPATPFLLVFVVLGLYLGATALRAVTTRRR